MPLLVAVPAMTEPVGRADEDEEEEDEEEKEEDDEGEVPRMEVPFRSVTADSA